MEHGKSEKAPHRLAFKPEKVVISATLGFLVFKQKRSRVPFMCFDDWRTKQIYQISERYTT